MAAYESGEGRRRPIGRVLRIVATCQQCGRGLEGHFITVEDRFSGRRVKRLALCDWHCTRLYAEGIDPDARAASPVP
jgi:hypothetical protein